MTILLYCFLISLLAITLMFGIKLRRLRAQGIMVEGEEYVISLEIPYAREAKEMTVQKIKRFGYISLVTTIRLYFRSSNIIKSRYERLKEKMRNVSKENVLNEAERGEVSRFLKIVSDYKSKVRRIKHQIKEEEKIL